MADGRAGTLRKLVLVGVSLLPLLPTLRAHAVGDLPVYYQATRAWLSGQVPYGEVHFEYPPYALLAFAPAAMASASLRDFQLWLGLELMAADGLVRLALLWAARHRRGGWAFGPFLAYALVAQVNAFWLYKRFDLFPVALTLVALLALSRGAGSLAGLSLAAGIGAKLYPLVLVPLALVQARRTGVLGRLVTGALVALAPLGVLALAWPIARALSFHASRGLQVESLWASVLWLLRDATGVEWVHAAASYEVQGGLAPATLRLAVVVWGVGVVAAVALSLRPPTEPGEGPLAARALLPVLALVALGPVFSPQYVLWVASLAALLVEPARWRLALAPLAAAVLTRLTYPAPGYQTGLGPELTAALVARNVLLLVGLVLLALAVLRRPGARGAPEALQRPRGERHARPGASCRP